MARGGTLLAVGAVLVIGLAGCSRLPFRGGPEVAPTEEALSAECLVGSWHQTEGWQRLDTDDGPMQIRLMSGGRDLTITAKGTATLTYTKPAVWKGSVGSLDLEATYTGGATLTYTASNGAWKEVADNTKVMTTIKVNTEVDGPRAGGAGRTLESTYRCLGSDLVLAGKDHRQVFHRA
jgi:hypothetical protein